MKIKYRLSFKEPYAADVYPAFAIRSVLGKQLKEMACALPEQTCPLCPLAPHCAYSQVFENPISRDNTILPGRNAMPHPYVLKTEQGVGSSGNDLQLQVVLMGDRSKLEPYVFEALKRAGANGLFRQRVLFTVNRVEQKAFDMPLLKNEAEERRQPLKLVFTSPLRLKRFGSMISKPTLEDLVDSATRRLELLCAAYGKKEGLHEMQIPAKTPCEYRTSWLDLNHYSGRQKRPMKLGGMIGSIRFKSVNPTVYQLFKNIENLHLGKNTSFGLGAFKAIDLMD
ncbi:MAG: hypothetical protein CR997_01955 [Acidobacteria bacterium]|nr:MAG: hypothetical protein CR997_01955 [Acidobacteriota bacterium]